MRGRFTLMGEVGRENHLVHPLVGRPGHQSVDTEIRRADAVERRDSAHQHEIQAAIGVGLLHHHQIRRRFDHAQLRRVATARRRGRT